MENSDDQFSLKWNNFQSNLATGFHDLLQEEDMVDVTLAAEGKFLQAHKIILSVCSPYFKDLFKVNPCKHPIVILKDVGHQELADMLDFMYRGEASVRQEDLAAFLKLAETLKVKGLAGDKGSDESSVSAHQSQKKLSLVPKKKKIVEATVFEPEDDPGDPDFNPSGGSSEPKRKRKRLSSPSPKTENASLSATNTFVPLANPKEEIQEQEEVEFLDDSTNDPLVQFMSGKQTKQDDGNDFDDSNQDLTGDETHEGDLDMTTAGPSNADDSTEQVPQEKLNSCEVRGLDFKETIEPAVPLLPKEDFPPVASETMQPPCSVVSRPKPEHQSKPVNEESYFQMSTPFTLPPSNYFPTNFVPQRQRSQSNEFRPPHDFSNPIWEYFTLEEDKATCKVCGKRITYRNNAYVTNLVTHLRTRGVGHDTCYNFYMMKKSETSNKVRDEIALNFLLTNMASTVFGNNQSISHESPTE